MGTPYGVSDDSRALPRLLYIGDVSVADTSAGEALLFRLLQFYPPDRLALICGVRPGMPSLPGAAYHHWGAAFPRLLTSRVAKEYCLWRAWRYYEVPGRISNVATMFKPEAILTISHVSGWLGAWQLAQNRGIPFYMIAHDDFVYEDRFPKWSRGWASARFGEAYRAAAARFCISDAMADVYSARFGAPGQVIYPTNSGRDLNTSISPRLSRSGGELTFGYGGSLNSGTDLQHLIAFAKIAAGRGHRLIVYSPQHALVAQRAAAAAVDVEARAPVQSRELLQRFRDEVDCLLLPQSMEEGDRPTVTTSFPSKWADYATLGIPVLAWVPEGSSSERFVAKHPGCAELVTTTSLSDVEAAIARLEGSIEHRQRLAEVLLKSGTAFFSPHAAWRTFRAALIQTRAPAGQ